VKYVPPEFDLLERGGSKNQERKKREYMNKKFFEVSSLAITIASLLTAVGCGSTPAKSVPAASPLSGLTGNLYQRCAAVGGSIYNYQGKELCRAEKVSPMVSMTYRNSILFPIVDATRPSVAPAFLTPVQVFKGDKVTFNGSGSWGTSSSDCNTVNGDGNLVSNGSPSSLHGGIKAGIVATDRTSIYFLGTNNQGITIQNNGYLSIGFNVPTPAVGTAPYCGSITVLSYRVLHCENATGSVACPF
jgi:hypothetical protein